MRPQQVKLQKERQNHRVTSNDASITQLDLTEDKQLPSGARGSYRGSIPEPGSGRSQRTQYPIGR
jgi:hypothetical protein